MIEFGYRTLIALRFSAILSNLSNLICIIGGIILIKYYCKDINNGISNYIKLFSLIPIITSIIQNIWFGILGNNSIWSFLNNFFPFIDNHCLIFMKIILVNTNIDMWSFQIFILMRINYFFNIKTQNVSNVKINEFVYKLLLCMLTFISYIYCTMAINEPLDVFKGIIYSNGDMYKQCELLLIDKNNTPNIYPILITTQNFMQLIILFICIKKLINFKKYINSTHFSQHFSGGNFNENIVFRFLFGSIIYIISYFVSFIILINYQWSFFPLAISIKIITIIISFDIFNKNYKLSIIQNILYLNNNLIQNNSINLNNNISNNEYIQELMRLYRNNTTNNDNINNI